MKSIIHTNTQVSRSQLIRFFGIYNNLDSFKKRVEIMLGVLIVKKFKKYFYSTQFFYIFKYPILIIAQRNGSRPGPDPSG